MATTNNNFVTDPLELAKKAEEIGSELDNPVVNLDRANYVTGTVSFGSLCIDLLTGGGMPPGKIVDVFGPEASGKSTLIGHTIANSMNLGIPCFYYDHECGADGMYLNALRVRIRLADGTRNPLFNYFQPTTGESTFRHINRLLDALPDYKNASGGRPQPTAAFFIDSIAAMLPEALDENDESNPMASGGRMLSLGLRQIKAKLGRKNCSLVYTNQTRLTPGVSFGNPEYEPGGQAVKFYPDLKIRMSTKGKPISERGRQIQHVTIRTPKNKQFVPFLESVPETVSLAFGRGFERGYDGYGYLVMTSQIIEKSGWFTLDVNDERFAEYNGKKMRWADLMPLCCANEFRQICQEQINSGDAFRRYFQHMNWERMYEFDEEDPGDLSHLTHEAFDPNTGEVEPIELA